MEQSVEWNCRPIPKPCSSPLQTTGASKSINPWGVSRRGLLKARKVCISPTWISYLSRLFLLCGEGFRVWKLSATFWRQTLFSFLHLPLETYELLLGYQSEVEEIKTARLDEEVRKTTLTFDNKRKSLSKYAFKWVTKTFFWQHSFWVYHAEHFISPYTCDRSANLEKLGWKI